MYNESDRMIFGRRWPPTPPTARSFRLHDCLAGPGLDPKRWSDPGSIYRRRFLGVSVRIGIPRQTLGEKADLYWTWRPGRSQSRGSLHIYGTCPASGLCTSDQTRPVTKLEDANLVRERQRTPHGVATAVYQHLADAYLITQTGGPHVIFGRGNVCPDALVTDFLVNDVVPAQRGTICDGFVMDDYVQISPRLAGAFKTPQNALSSVETEIYYLPEYFYWDGFTPTAVGCTYGGTLGIDSNFAGTRSLFTLNKCAFTTNFIRQHGFHAPTDRFVWRFTHLPLELPP